MCYKISNNDIKLVEKYVKILGLKSRDIYLVGSNKETTYISRIEKEDMYVVHIPPNVMNFQIVHELGHIFLAEKTNYPSFAGYDNICIPIECEPIAGEINFILDWFVNYPLVQFKKINDIFIEWFEKHWGWAKGKIHEYPENINEILSLYNFLYINANFIIDNSYKTIRIAKRNFLRRIREIVGIHFNQKHINFNDLHRKLTCFSQIKNTKKSKDIIHFIYIIVNTMNFYKKDFKKIFQIAFNFKASEKELI